jgi:predicted Zn-dependent protease
MDRSGIIIGLFHIKYPIMIQKITSLFILCALFVACSQNVLSGKNQLTLVSEAELQNMANQQYRQFLSTNRVVTSSNNRDADMTRRVGQRITQAVTNYYRERGLSENLQGYKWEYNLVDNKAVNAWCMPGGKIVVYTGLLPVTQNEAALAVVIGHEVSHALLQHGNQRMSQGLLQQLGGVALSVALANKPQETQNLFMTAYGVGSQVGVLLPFSRKHELEADRYGLIFTALAGYNPQEAIGLWQRMEKASQGGRPPEFLSTHPSEGRRIRELQQMMPEAMKHYRPMGR